MRTRAPDRAREGRGGLRLPLAAGALLAALAGPAAADPAPVPAAESILAHEPPELVSRLLAEKIVVLEDIHRDGEGAFIVAYVIFEKSRPEVLDLLTQSSRQTEYRPELRSVRLVKDWTGGRIDEHRMKILFSNVVYRLRYERDPVTDRLEWRLDPDFDNDLRRLEGFWELYAMGESRTLGRFGSIVNVGPALPRFVQDGLTRRAVLGTVANTRHWVDSDGRWRP